MRREERVTVQGPVKKQQPDGMSHRGVSEPVPQSPPPPPVQRDSQCTCVRVGCGGGGGGSTAGRSKPSHKVVRHNRSANLVHRPSPPPPPQKNKIQRRPNSDVNKSGPVLRACPPKHPAPPPDQGLGGGGGREHGTGQADPPRRPLTTDRSRTGTGRGGGDEAGG